MDADRDGKLFEKEALEYAVRTADLQAAAGAARVALKVSQQGNGLFDLFDANSDGRLSDRELRQVPAVLRSLDRDKDGSLTRSDVPRSYLVMVEPGSVSGNLLGAYLGSVGVGNFSTEPQVPQAGPLWFRKMDRNRDGDVSRREFLGTDAHFRQIDADGDGLLSSTEAERYDQQARPR
jgi:hypothetical protein